MNRLDSQMALTKDESILTTDKQITDSTAKKKMAEVDANNSMVTKEVQIINKMGLHARPAMQFVDLANKFTSRITVCKNKQCVNAKSIMELLLLAAAAGTKLVIQAQGGDASDACESLAKLVESKFGEE
jgi:phosphocarrier protein